MKAKEIRQKLIIDFENPIQDDTKLAVVEGVFDAIKKEEIILSVPENHCQKVEESRTEYHLGIGTGISWEELEKLLNTKYGF